MGSAGGGTGEHVCDTHRIPRTCSGSQLCVITSRNVVPCRLRHEQVINSSPPSRSESLVLAERESCPSPPQNVFCQRQQLLFEMIQTSLGSGASLNASERSKKSAAAREHTIGERNRKAADDNLSIVLSAFYAKFVVVLGIAFPVTDILSSKAPRSFYQGFYLYLYLVSVTFVVFMFLSHLRTRMKFAALLHSYRLRGEEDKAPNLLEKPIVRYGSFYLRIVAVAFGIGTMVYSGLEFGQYFELKKDQSCQNALIVLNPAARMILTVVQMQFIFLNTKDIGLTDHKVLARFGLMHMVATNLCEWLYVLVEETKHEMIHTIPMINKHNNTFGPLNESSTIIHHVVKRATAWEIVVDCRRTNIMGSLVQDASPFLFPCTIEYSLICAVTLFEMWKRIRRVGEKDHRPRKLSTMDKGAHHFSVDCSRAHRGMFGGILVVVLCIISLIIYFTMSRDPLYKHVGILGITISEVILFTSTIFGTFMAMYQMRDLRYSKDYYTTQSLDCNLLVVAQSGVYIYTMFSIVGFYFSLDAATDGYFGLANEFLCLFQTSVQTIFILNAWWRRCRSSHERRNKPGREIVTFLLVSNIALWAINTLIKSRADFRPTHVQFFGHWAWTVITHISMPLAIFYRLHSTICLFEIWKTTYKVKN